MTWRLCKSSFHLWVKQTLAVVCCGVFITATTYADGEATDAQSLVESLDHPIDQVPDDGMAAGVLVPPKPKNAVRFATFNASLFREQEGQLARDLEGGQDEQARKVAEIVQMVQPDVLLINEFDRVSTDKRRNAPRASLLFLHEYLLVPHGEQKPLAVPIIIDPPVNTGRLSSVDLDGDGDVKLPQDAMGWGAFPGQYGMLLLTRYPVAFNRQRTFRNLRWLSMPEHRMPLDYYSPAAQEVMRLSSKTHADVPLIINNRIVHVLISHPTPPVFDGEEDRNGKRNYDEIRFWADYISGDPAASRYIMDDKGAIGGLTVDDYFVVLGDLNADPNDGDTQPGAIVQLLENPRVHESVAKVIPQSLGAAEAAAQQGGINEKHVSSSLHDTADFPEGNGPGNLRTDYIIPSQGIEIIQAGVFWPTKDHPKRDLIDVSDHRLVWVDVIVE